MGWVRGEAGLRGVGCRACAQAGVCWAGGSASAAREAAAQHCSGRAAVHWQHCSAAARSCSAESQQQVSQPGPHLCWCVSPGPPAPCRRPALRAGEARQAASRRWSVPIAAARARAHERRQPAAAALQLWDAGCPRRCRGPPCRWSCCSALACVAGRHHCVAAGSAALRPTPTSSCASARRCAITPAPRRRADAPGRCSSGCCDGRCAHGVAPRPSAAALPRQWGAF